MDRFCAKCGSPLDRQQGLCPACDGAELRTLRMQGYSKKKTVRKKAPPRLNLIAGLLTLVAVAALATLVILHFSSPEPEWEPETDMCTHKWQDADCLTPQTCSRCTETRGTALGHDWMAATCAVPATCTRCGQTQGTVLEHSWTEATCTLPVICSFCGQTAGEALGHIWVEATFTEPKTCTRCGGTEGSPMDHQSISVEDRVEDIKAVYYNIRDNLDLGYYTKVMLRDGVAAYRDSRGQTVFVEVYRGTEGIGEYSSIYSRTYYFEGGELVFAFFEGSDSHRLYFCQGLLMRWKYKKSGNSYAVDHDFEFSEEFCMWEALALAEVETFS